MNTSIPPQMVPPQMATWLELTLCTLRHEQPIIYRVHEIQDDYDMPRNKARFAISLNGRWLCASDGYLTIFESRHAAEHFLGLLKVSHIENGDPICNLGGEACEADCICLQTEHGTHHAVEARASPRVPRHPLN